MKLKQTFAENPALMWLLVWGGALVAVVIAIKIFAKKPNIPAKPTGITASDQHSSEPAGGFNLTIINPQPVTGAPSGGSSGGTSGGSSGGTTGGGSSGGGSSGGGSPKPTQSPVYVTVATWTPINPPWNSYLGGIAGHYGETLSQLLGFPENARYRANPNLVHPGDRVRVK